MKTNPLLRIKDFGQSVWLDFIRRGMLLSGEFQSLIDNDGVLGVTSNPSIFEKAITGTHDYDSDIQVLSRAGKTAKEIYNCITIQDIQSAADIFRQTFDKTSGQDGFVSLEVSPHLAHDTEGTIKEARALCQSVDRPNLLIKVPATVEGIGAIQKLIGDGISVNVTLLFSIDRYLEIVEAYFSGLELRLREGKSIRGITSVASFFLSRIDVLVDSKLLPGSNLRGEIAIASAKLAFKKYSELFSSERFLRLKNLGASSQRLLWASTSTKDNLESDIKYIEALIGPATINTVPFETLNAYRDHGNPENRLVENLSEALQNLESLREMKIDLQKLTLQLENEGVQKFALSYDKLIAALEVKRNADFANAGQSKAIALSNCEDVVKKRIGQLHADNVQRRIWQKDATLWKSDKADQAMIKNSLGWLHIAEKMENSIAEIETFVEEIKKTGFERVVHMGMGGSSLAALVFARTFSSKKGLPLTILDTTDPESIRSIERALPPEKTLFIVASKSGNTAEPLAFMDYFFERVKLIKGKSAGENFIAITDHGSSLEKNAEEQGFRRIFLNPSDIGGRYSALSYFGLIPAALMGVDIREVLNRAIQAAHKSTSSIPGFDSPALVLGAALGEMALRKRNKMTILADKPIEALGLWIEQLVAESTGKEEKGIIPIVDGPLGAPSDFRDDRLFINITIKGSDDDLLKKEVTALRHAGHPVITIEMLDRFDLGEQFFQWEFATAVAGSILEINPFDQPNVQESKNITDALLSKNEITLEKPSLEENSLQFYSSINVISGTELLKQFLKLSFPGDYIALMAFLPEASQTHEILQDIRQKLRDKLGLATTLGYGPRFLHSTGQLHKGGPVKGLFIQLTADDTVDVGIPNRAYSFGNFKQAQAQGDLKVLRKHGDRVIRVHLGNDIGKGLRELEELLNTVLRSI